MESIDEVQTPADLLNPPTEFIAEAHPGISTDERHDVTAKIADVIQSPEKEMRESEAAKFRESDTKSEAPRASRLKQSSEKGAKQDSKHISVLLAEDNIVSRNTVMGQSLGSIQGSVVQEFCSDFCPSTVQSFAKDDY